MSIHLSRDQAARLWPIIKQYAEGADVQRLSRTFKEWVDEKDPFFDPEFEWRVKPQGAELADNNHILFYP